MRTQNERRGDERSEGKKINFSSLDDARALFHDTEGREEFECLTISRTRDSD
jgi:hypothetical protein